jgi:hypothetical protein
VPVVLVTHQALEPALQAAADELAKLPQLHQPPLRLRIEDNLASGATSGLHSEFSHGAKPPPPAW